MNHIINVIYWVHILIIVVCAASECVPAFSTPENRPYYDLCEQAVCILYRTEAPFVFLGPQMKNLEHQRPVLCSEYMKQQNSGALFKFIEHVKPLEGAYCVWAGPECGFDEMLDFMKKSARQGDKHMWMIGAILFALDYRISNYSIASLALYEDRLRIIGPPIQGYTSVREALNTLLKPFTRNGWIYIAGCVLISLLLRIPMAFICTELHVATQIFEWNQFKSRIFDINNTYKRREESEEKLWRRLNKFWLSIATIFVVTMMIFWEVAIAAQVYETRLSAPAQNIDASRVAITRKTSQLFVFKSSMEYTEKLWHEYDTIEDVYRAVRNESNNIDYTVQYGVFNRYQMKTNPEICIKLRRYDEFPSQVVETRKPPSLSGVWFYSTRISLNRCIEIDKAISVNKKKGVFQNIIDEISGDDVADSCKLKNTRIGWVLLGFLHAVVVGIPQMFFVITVAVFMFYCCYGRIRDYLWEEQEDTETFGDDRDFYDIEDLTESSDLPFKSA